MSYPDPRYDGSAYPPPTYHGEGGEPTARLRRHDHPAELRTGAGFAHYLATGASTGGQFGLYRWDMGPRAGGPGPHFHRTISESFFVLEGQVTLYDGTRWTPTSPGDFCFVPEGGVHGFRNDTDEAASMLILFSPGAPREGYFEGLVEIAQSGRELSQEEWDAFFAKHDNIWV
ncbi:cupin domain-containing protein [Nocardioides caldifontis]|uniref:cupin domain-containing protein n=1 Tax=Nocardioides caldifontis TaxID=2588938 RepID=UPI0011DF515C|nr:cupin domain-containing protein [Nocardioides caldifontis]